MRKLIALMVIFALLSMTELAQVGDVAAGKIKAASCTGCHGIDGVSDNLTIPSLAGQQPAYTLLQLEAFKSGDGKNPIMNAIAASLSENDMKSLAQYVAGL